MPNKATHMYKKEFKFKITYCFKFFLFFLVMIQNFLMMKKMLNIVKHLTPVKCLKLGRKTNLFYVNSIKIKN